MKSHGKKAGRSKLVLTILALNLLDYHGQIFEKAFSRETMERVQSTVRLRIYPRRPTIAPGDHKGPPAAQFLMC